MYEELYSDEEENIIESDIDSISSSMLVEGVGDFDDSKSSNLADRVIYVDEDTANKIYSKIEHYYGKTYLSKGEIKKLRHKIVEVFMKVVEYTLQMEFLEVSVIMYFN